MWVLSIISMRGCGCLWEVEKMWYYAQRSGINLSNAMRNLKYKVFFKKKKIRGKYKVTVFGRKTFGMLGSLFHDI